MACASRFQTATALRVRGDKEDLSQMARRTDGRDQLEGSALASERLSRKLEASLVLRSQAYLLAEVGTGGQLKESQRKKVKREKKTAKPVRERSSSC